MTGDAAFTKRVMAKDKRPRLIAMTLRATLVLPRHRQSASRFHDIHPMRIMALDAIHAAFQDWMMLGKMKLPLHIQVALKTGGWIFARIDDESFTAAQTRRRNMTAARTVTGFTPALPGHRRILRMEPRVRAGRKSPHNVRVTIGAGFVADIMRPGNFQRRRHLRGGRGTGTDEQRHQG
jgi:hypothetical protein